MGVKQISYSYKRPFEELLFWIIFPPTQLQTADVGININFSTSGQPHTDAHPNSCFNNCCQERENPVKGVGSQRHKGRNSISQLIDLWDLRAIKYALLLTARKNRNGKIIFIWHAPTAALRLPEASCWERVEGLVTQLRCSDNDRREHGGYRWHRS